MRGGKGTSDPEWRHADLRKTCTLRIMTRSFPEKTFEHWCSTHLTYRYRAKLRQWWPAAGADIDVEMDPKSFKAILGKRFWLELKVPEWKPTTQQHALQIDLKQLQAYNAQPVPAYYVFPIPEWSGVLGDRASQTWLSPLHRSDLAIQAHSYDQWFARWTWVVSASDLTRALAIQLSKFASGTRKTEVATVANIAPSAKGKAGTLAPVRGTAALSPILWHEFLKKMEQCGDADFPAQFILPKALTLPKGTNVSSTILRSRLSHALSKIKEGTNPVVSKAAIYSPVGHEDTYSLEPNLESMSSEGFAWGHNTARGLVSLPFSALDLG